MQSTPRLREELGEDVELVDHAVFEIIADGNAGMSDLEAISVVDRKELLDPGLEQVAAGQAVRFGELEEGGGVFHRVGDLAVLVHARRAVPVELAELHLVIIFVYERVDACEGSSAS